MLVMVVVVVVLETTLVLGLPRTSRGYDEADEKILMDLILYQCDYTVTYGGF